MKNSFLQNSFRGLSDLFYPELCEACQRHLNKDETTLCLFCILKLPRTDFYAQPENKASQVFIGRLTIEHATSFVYFTKEGMVQELMHHFKYKGKKKIGKLFGNLLAAELSDVPWIKDIDVILPVPLHKTKEQLRGFNQAALFAAGLGGQLNIQVDTEKLIRTKFTDSQTTKSRQARLANVEDAFSIKDHEQLIGKHILLVDDVLTTGATLESCALKLLRVAGVKVSIATIALAKD
jgi:ComF family protein